MSSLLSSLAKLASLLPSPASISWLPRGGRPTIAEGLQRLERLLLRIQATLEDAGERQVQDSSVRLWVEELTGLARDAEDVLDDHRYELLRRRAQECAAASTSPDPKQDDKGDFDISEVIRVLGFLLRFPSK